MRRRERRGDPVWNDDPAFVPDPRFDVPIAVLLDLADELEALDVRATALCTTKPPIGPGPGPVYVRLPPSIVNRDPGDETDAA